MSRRVGLAVTIAAILGVAVAPSALGTHDATPHLLEVTMVGTYSELRETISKAPGGTGSLHEVVDLRWQARTAVACKPDSSPSLHVWLNHAVSPSSRMP